MEPNQIKNSGFLYKKALNSAIGFVVQKHPSTISEINKQFRSKKIIVSNFCGVDSTKFRHSGDKIFDAVFIGWLSERKGIQFIPEIWDKVCREIKSAKLLIITRGPAHMKDWLTSEFLKRGIMNNVEFNSEVDEAQKSCFLAKSKIFLFPSVYEGFGLAIAEALASNVPAVLWDLPSFDNFSQGVLKVKPYDNDKYASACVELLSDTEKRATLGENGQRLVSQKFSLEEAAINEEQAIKEMYNYSRLR